MRNIRWILCVSLLALAGGCKSTYALHYKASSDLNAPAGTQGQPVLIGLYTLSKPPRELVAATCEQLPDPTAVTGLLGDALVEEEQPLSVVPGDRSVYRIPRRVGARWLLMVPFFEDPCGDGADRWALVRLSRFTRSRSIELSASTLELPWERRPWRQRGCVSGRASHVVWQICE